MAACYYRRFSLYAAVVAIISIGSFFSTSTASFANGPGGGPDTGFRSVRVYLYAYHHLDLLDHALLAKDIVAPRPESYDLRTSRLDTVSARLFGAGGSLETYRLRRLARAPDKPRVTDRLAA